MESGDGRRGQALHTAAAPALRAVAAVALRATHFETENSAFLKLQFKTQKINAITQVSQGILSTTVQRTSD